MKIAVSSDARTHLVDAILEDLGKRGHEVEYLGPEPGKEVDWPVVTLKAAERVAQGRSTRTPLSNSITLGGQPPRQSLPAQAHYGI